jgi:phospholipid transport system substrate-binding protein
VTSHFLSVIFDQVTSKPIVPKAAARKAVALATGLAIAMLAYPTYAALTSGGDTVQGLYDALLGTMKSGRTLGQSGRFARLEPVIRRTFDITTMARLSVGSSWATLSEAQRRQVVESFGRYISAIYAERFDSYAGQKLQVTGEQPAADGIIVKSQIIKANGEPVNVDYQMRRNGGTWLISDVYLDGAISEVATRRSEFGAILKNEGIDGLITALNRKADILNGSTQALSRTNPGAEVAESRGSEPTAGPRVRTGLSPAAQALPRTNPGAEVAELRGHERTTGPEVRTGLTPAARHQQAASIKKLQVSKTSIKKLQISKTTTNKLQVSKNKHSPPVSLALNGARTNRTMSK